jgi:hypothetical protein
MDRREKGHCPPPRVCRWLQTTPYMLTRSTGPIPSQHFPNNTLCFFVNLAPPPPPSHPLTPSHHLRRRIPSSHASHRRTHRVTSSRIASRIASHHILSRRRIPSYVFQHVFPRDDDAHGSQRPGRRRRRVRERGQRHLPQRLLGVAVRVDSFESKL